MKKPRKQSDEPVGWKVYIMRAKLTWLGFVVARDEQDAIDRAMRELNIREADRFRVSVRRDKCVAAVEVFREDACHEGQR